MTNVTKKPIEKTEELAKVSDNGLPSYDLSKSLPDLSKQEIVPIDLMADYWTPTTVNESKRLFFDKIATRNTVDQQSGEAIELECAFFVEQINGEVKSISNGSKRLVGAMQNNGIQRGTPLLITYLGKKKNASNGFSSDNWSVKPLMINI
jgi:hypothetical protein